MSCVGHGWDDTIGANMTEHELNMQRGRACLRAVELHNLGFSDRRIAGTLRSWWRIYTTEVGSPWDADSVHLAIRSTLQLAQGEIWRLWMSDVTIANVGRYAMAYRRKFHEVHGPTLDAVQSLRSRSMQSSTEAA